MYTILGIGNPEEQYSKTRHNIGFMMLDFISKKIGVDFEPDKKLNCQTAKGELERKKIQLIKPQTYVNKSGDTLKKIKIKPSDLVVVHDDLDIPFGKVKLSFDKDSAGHKGIESIMRSLKTKKFFRLRIGLANSALKRARRQKTINKKTEAVGNFVLSKFTPSEQKELPKILKQAFEIIQSHIS